MDFIMDFIFWIYYHHLFSVSYNLTMKNSQKNSTYFYDKTDNLLWTWNQNVIKIK